MSLLSPLLDAGLNSVKIPSERRGIQLSNQISLVLFILISLLFVLYYIWYDWNFVTISIPLAGIVSLLPIVLNRINKTILSRVLLSFLVPITTTVISVYSKKIYYGSQEELDYFTFRFLILASCVFPAILFSLKEKWSLAFTSLGGLIILLAYDPIHFIFGVPYRSSSLKESNYYFTNAVIFITYCIMVGAVYFMKYVSERSEEKAAHLIDELNQINEELVEKNSEIEAQNQEISAQSENLNNNQEKLIEAYGLIEEQKDLLFTQNKNLSSELLERNKDLMETNSELIKHNNELRQFSYTVSHNLRGPVASLMGLANLIEPASLSEENKDFFEHIKTSIDRLDAIIRDLSKIIDIRHDLFQIRQKIILNNELKEITLLLRKEIESHRIIIRKDFNQCPDLYSVKPMVHSILYNLISNAIKYRSLEHVAEITISARQEDNYYVLEVTDNGLGIDIKRNKENLFKLYKRFHSHTEGKGIGLYLVKLQAEALGGSVEVQSELNKFTKFTVHLGKPKNIQRQILYEEPFAKIFYDAKINATGVIWRGPVTSQQYRNVFLKCLDFVKAYNAPNYIADISNQGHIDREDQQWMFTEIIPESIRNGLRRIAAVRPDFADPIVQEYLRGINESLVKLGACQEFFMSIEEASDWIQEENEKASLTDR